MSLRWVRLLTISTGALAFAFLMTALAPTASAGDTPPACAVLAADPAVAANPAIKSASSAIVAAAGKDVAYCKVHLLYGTNPNQNINIVVGLS